MPGIPNIINTTILCDKEPSDKCKCWYMWLATGFGLLVRLIFLNEDTKFLLSVEVKNEQKATLCERGYMYSQYSPSLISLDWNDDTGTINYKIPGIVVWPCIVRVHVEVGRNSHTQQCLTGIFRATQQERPQAACSNLPGSHHLPHTVYTMGFLDTTYISWCGIILPLLPIKT